MVSCLDWSRKEEEELVCAIEINGTAAHSNPLHKECTIGLIVSVLCVLSAE